MSCYLPIIQRWRKQDRQKGSNRAVVAPPIVAVRQEEEEVLSDCGEHECSHILAMRDGRGLTLSQGLGDFPHEVLLNIRHDHPTLGLGDVAYQRLHQDHTRQRPKQGHSRSETASPGVVSLGLPLGISSLRGRKKKMSKRSETMSDGEFGTRLEDSFYQTLKKPSLHIPLIPNEHSKQEQNQRRNNLQPMLNVERNNNRRQNQTDFNMIRHSQSELNQEKQHQSRQIQDQLNLARRKSSLPRRTKIPSHFEERSRPRSVDADLLLQSIDISSQIPRQERHQLTCQTERRAVSNEDILKFAHLTSTHEFMEKSQEGEKSSSGNSSGSITSGESPPPPELLQRQPVMRRSELSVAVANKGPPPRHLLPQRLRPSPTTKMHPLVVIPQRIWKELESANHNDLSEPELFGMKTSSIHGRTKSPPNQLQYKKKESRGLMDHSPPTTRPGSPFGRSRHATPHGSQRRIKSSTPSPLDPGYQTLEHSYDGDSSLSSNPSIEVVQPPKPSRLRPSPCLLSLLPDAALTSILSYLTSMELARISRTCHRLNHLSWQHQLWSSISLTGDQLDADKAVRAILGRLVREATEASVGLTEVRQVSLGGCARLTDRSLALLARNLPALEQLEVQKCRNITNGGILDLVTRCRSLSHLDVTGCPMISSINVGGRRKEQLVLTHLDVSECPSIDDTGLQMMVTNCPRLTHLYLRKCANITDTGVRSIASYCPQLRELSISDCPLLTDYSLTSLASIGPSLRYLSVAKCPGITSAGVHHVTSHCYKLRYINLRGCEDMTDATLTSLSRSCTRLRSLDLGKCHVTDAGLVKLSRQLPRLRKLSVRECPGVGDKGVAAMARGCPGLLHLNVQGCRVSLETCALVAKYARQCYIEHSALVN